MYYLGVCEETTKESEHSKIMPGLQHTQGRSCTWRRSVCEGRSYSRASRERKVRSYFECRGQGYMYCRKCGKKIPDNARFCNHCGTPVVSAVPEKTGTYDDMAEAPSDRRTEENRQGSRDAQEYDLQFRGNMVSCEGHAVHHDYDSEDDEQTEHEKKESSGLVLFIALGAAIIFLTAAIAWQAITLVQINRDATNFNLTSAIEETVSMSEAE